MKMRRRRRRRRKENNKIVQEEIITLRRENIKIVVEGIKKLFASLALSVLTFTKSTSF